MNGSAIDQRVLEATAALHKMDLAVIQQRFSHIPVDITDVEPFQQSLRLVISSHCEQRCQYPEEGVLWCHNEGVARDALKAAHLDSLLKLARFFRDHYGIQRIKIGGLEPVLGSRLLDMIHQLREMGITDVSFTTHGRGVNGKLAELKAAGLTRLTISIQHFDRENNIRLTGRDGLPGALELVEEAKEAGLTPLKINRVLLRGYTDDLPRFIEWVRAQDVTVRLFDLMWQPGHDSYYLKYLISWQEFLPLWDTAIERIIVRRYRTSWRTRITFKLRGGGAIEGNLLLSKRFANAPICQACRLADVCAEGYLGCGIRITPDLKLSPCILRNDLAQSMHPLLQADQSDTIARLIDDQLQGIVDITGQPIQLMALDDAKQRLPQLQMTVNK